MTTLQTDPLVATEADPPKRGPLETGALVVLSIGFVLPIVGYLFAAALVLSSKAWSARDKVVGLLIPPAVFAIGGVVALAAGASFTVAVLLLAFSGLLGAAFLAWRLRRAS